MESNKTDKEYVEIAASEESPSGMAPGEIIIGSLSHIGDRGQPFVKFSHHKEAIAAISTVSLLPQDKGRQLALLFANGDLQTPVVMGLIHNPLTDLLDNVHIDNADTEQTKTETPANENNIQDEVYIDSKQVFIEGQEEIVLKCGEASITLTKSGKILIRGKYLLNRSTGVNRIMGGSVQLN